MVNPPPKKSVDAIKHDPARRRPPTAEYQSVLDEAQKNPKQAHKEDRIGFTSLVAWPGDLVCAEGRYIGRGAKIGSGEMAVD